MAKGTVRDNWEKENIQRIIFKVRKDDKMLEDMREAIEKGIAENQTALIREAVKEWLEKYL